ncbi:hypothetical protein BE15_29905 [Sorangium cellulosum]|uniref:DUF1349 domain-containing protein n=1 Tax=Sorangium cellulosum TaxID=56 RepID=A0A150QD94_SORCE|nr:hypothetical protein BE15_29905 [Sorangium cellulosum]
MQGGDNVGAPVYLAPFPAPLRWEVPPRSWSVGKAASLTVTAGGETDLFLDPERAAGALNAPRLLGTPHGDFLASARVAVGFASARDAGALLLWAHERSWAKLCFELSPEREPTVVSVVTRGLSESRRSFAVHKDHVWLRASRLGRACAFHASTDGSTWQLVRSFSLGIARDLSVGFSAQSPAGDGCTAVFDDIRFTPRRLGDLRSGHAAGDDALARVGQMPPLIGMTLPLTYVL